MRSMPAIRHAVVLALAAVLTAAGCGDVAPSLAPSAPPPSPAGPTPTPRPAAEVYGEIRAAVEAIRGLQPTTAVEPVSLDEAQLRANLTADFDRENTADELALAEDLLITLGLLPAGSSIRTIMLDFQAGQVAGYYSPDKDELFVVSRSGGLGAAEMVTYAHEFTHQLQDQRFDLAKLGLDAADQSDRQLAHLALVEGDAVSVQSSWMTTNLTPQQLGELLGASLDPEAVEALQKAPPFIRETALFPYEAGLGFVAQLVGTAGYEGIDAAFGAPPASTEQILHPEKYGAGEAPAAVTIPGDVASVLGSGWAAAGQDTLGELILRIWLTEGGVTRAEATAATAGWGGDRLVILRGPDDAVGVGMITTWDTAADAAEFFSAATTAVASIDPNGWVTSDGLRTVYVALGEGESGIVAALGGGSPGG
jgi:hypothetical protein